MSSFGSLSRLSEQLCVVLKKLRFFIICCMAAEEKCDDSSGDSAMHSDPGQMCNSDGEEQTDDDAYAEGQSKSLINVKKNCRYG